MMLEMETESELSKFKIFKCFNFSKFQISLCFLERICLKSLSQTEASVTSGFPVGPKTSLKSTTHSSSGSIEITGLCSSVPLWWPLYKLHVTESQGKSAAFSFVVHSFIHSFKWVLLSMLRTWEKKISHVQWCMHAWIPALERLDRWKVRRRLALSYIVKPCLSKNKIG